MSSVPAADVQAIEVERSLENRRNAQYAATPTSLADSFERPVGEVVFVGPSAPERVVSELEIRRQTSVDEQRGSETGTECQNDLDARARNHPVALKIGIVKRKRRALEGRGHPSREIQTDPMAITEVWRSSSYSSRHDTREPHRDPVERALARSHAYDERQHSLGRRRSRRTFTRPRPERTTAFVDSK